MTTATATKTFTFNASYSSESLTLVHVTRTDKTCRIDLCKMDSYTQDQRNLLVDIQEEGLINRVYKMELSMEQLNLLAPLNMLKNAKTVQQTNNVIHQGMKHHKTVQVSPTTIDEVSTTKQKIESLEKLAGIYDQDFWTVEYDIPEVVSKHADHDLRVNNPSGWFWRHGLRKSLSCWFFPNESFDHPDVAAWLADARQKGCQIIALKIARDQVETIRALALKELRTFLIGLHTGLIQSIANADAKMVKAKEALLLPCEDQTETKTEQQIDTLRHSAVRTMIANAAKNLDMAIQCAEKFDMTENVADLLNALRNAVRANAISFNMIAREKGIKSAPLPK